VFSEQDPTQQASVACGERKVGKEKREEGGKAGKEGGR
jgi:hypothetical protein